MRHMRGMAVLLGSVAAIFQKAKVSPVMESRVIDKAAIDSLRGPERSVVHFAIGKGAVLGLSEKLIEFSARCGQPGAMHDVGYFLSKPGALPRTPYLLLVGAAELDLNSRNFSDLLGVLLIYEHRVVNLGGGAFATNDRSGRNTLVAMPSQRALVAGIAARALLDRGAEIVLMSFRGSDSGNLCGAGVPLLKIGPGGRAVARWSVRERTIPGYLELLPSYDATLATIGQRTRSNLRYYRRRAESQLGCEFVPEMKVSREEVVAFNEECMYGVSAKVMGGRYDSLEDLAEPVFMGIRDRDGRWLSMLGGRRYLDRSELLWQMNRNGFRANSLGTVMRSYYIEHEIARGSRRLYIEGGTPHPIKFSFVPETLIDLGAVRQSLTAKAMQFVARRYVPPDNELSHMLSAKSSDWFYC